MRDRPVQTSNLEDAGDHSGRLPKRQAEERGAEPVQGGKQSTGLFPGRPSPLIIRQNWMAASEKTGGRPGLPAFGASQSMSRSSQTSSDPRRSSASL